jgi:hypothetical protein
MVASTGKGEDAGDHFILFTRLPLIYGRVPKVANSSVKAALTRLLEQPPEEGFRTTADVLWRKGTHGETTMIDAAAALERRSSHFCFSFVRNPFDRLVSAYNNKLIENDHLSTAMQRMGLERKMPFRRFLEVVAATADADLDVHLLPQEQHSLQRRRARAGLHRPDGGDGRALATAAAAHAPGGPAGPGQAAQQKRAPRRRHRPQRPLPR